MRACYRGEPVELPIRLLHAKRALYQAHRHLPHTAINAGGYVVVTEALRDVMMKFDLGETRFHPVTLVTFNYVTPYEGTHFILQVMPMQKTVIPDLSTHFHLHNDPDLPYLGVIQSEAEDDEIVALPEVREGPDIWRDPRLKNAIFMSDRLLKAISEARLLAPVSAIRCRLAAKA